MCVANYVKINNSAMLIDEYRYKMLKELEANPEITKQELTKGLGISLSKINSCIQASVEKGLIKARNFKNSQNKKAYIYVLRLSSVRQFCQGGYLTT